ncbi:MAG: glycosyltransferase family 1 protein [Synechococcus sp. MIT S9220]|uniref:glycosyltransferase family 1 protein n=1 Tax=unclassified Synechococcus TaxID=2626047 RepID=UPI00164C5409|nr:glycosyltransferase family 1 protein [Synechococcus sp. MIT S9220]NOL48041.1 glycosyltransferase family 1 protein [Synechococcus sp. MIT S9220]
MGKHTIVDYPKKEILYNNAVSSSLKKEIYGHGFTLYGLLPDRKIDRALIWKRLESGWFDIVIIANIWRQFTLLSKITKSINHENTKLIILDGDDDARIYPFSGSKLKEHGFKPSDFGVNSSQYKNYFKREIDNSLPQSSIEMIIPSPLRMKLRKRLSLGKMNPKECGFSIPKEWIREPKPSNKTNQFQAHIVDKEVREYFKCGQSDYAFKSQKEYYDDLALARFGITTKRAGWDCLRHYEIAAAGTVPCFRELMKKPSRSAPHGLNENNCILYENVKDLESRIKQISDNEYYKLLGESHDWIKNKTTIKSAEEMLKSATYE